jgi:hypothetical protein
MCFWTELRSLSRGGAKSDFWGRYTPGKNDPFSCPVNGIIAWKLLTGFRLLPQYWGREKGSFFYGGVSPLKIGLITPCWETVHLRLKARVFLLSENKRRLLCMGCTYAAKRRTLLTNWRATVWAFARGAELEPGTCKSTRRGAKFILNSLNIEAHVKSDVMRSYGISGCFLMVELIGGSSICLSVVICANFGLL